MSNEIRGTVATTGTMSGNLNAVFGKDGESAYEIALANGFEGTEAEWVASLKGDTGNSGVYLGAGEMPDDCNVQIDLTGDVLVIDQTYNPRSTNPQSGTAIEEALIELIRVYNAKQKISYVTLKAEDWVGDASPYSQAVTINGTTENSKIDLNPTVEQLDIFKKKDVTFVTENEDGEITVFAIGQKPTNDYTMQVTITEVVANV